VKPAEKIAAAALVCGVLAGLFVFVHPWYDAKNDAALYIATARSIADGEGYSYLGRPFHLRPPGFAVLLAPLVGTLGTDFHAMNLFVSLFGAAGIVLLFFYQRSRLGWLLALLVAIGVWLNPIFQSYCNQVMSDVPGTTLLLACLLLERRASRSPSAGNEVLLGVAVALATLVRWINILLLPAIVVARLLERQLGEKKDVAWPSFLKRSVGVFLACAVVLLAPWIVRNHLVAPPPPADQTLVYDYQTAMWHDDPGDPASPRVPPGTIVARSGRNALEMMAAVVTRMHGQEHDAWRVALGVAVVLCAAYVLFKRRGPAEFFVAGVSVVLAAYFTFATRLILPVYVIVLPAVVEALRDLLRRFAGARAATAVLAVALAGLIVADFAPREGWAEIERRHRTFAEHCNDVESRLAPDARLGSTVGRHYGVFLDRPVHGLLQPMQNSKNPADIETLIDRYGLNTVVMSGLVRAGLPSRNRAGTRRLLGYLRETYEEVDAGQGSIFRVRP
jgi:4-amino-4-deoxy-L-arabinose transferase-like glycosyltransferase